MAAGNSWGDVLMHVASLPSSSSAAGAGSIRQHKARSDSSAGASNNEGVRHAEGDRHLSGSGGGSGGEGVGGELSPTDASGKVASGAGGGGGGGGGDGGVGVGAAGSRQRRSMSGESLLSFLFCFCFVVHKRESLKKFRIFEERNIEGISVRET